jgi:hypothetical protein
MKIGVRILAGLTILLCVAGLLLGLAGGVGVWIVKGPTTDRVTHLIERVEAALNVADTGLDHAKSSLARAAERLDGVKEEQQKLSREPRTNSAMRGLMARTVRQRIAPEIGDAHETLHTVAEAAVVVNSVLEDIGNLPFLSTTNLDVGRISEINGRLSEVGPAAWELSRLLGEPGSDSDPEAVNSQLSRIEQALKMMQGMVADYAGRIADARQQTAVLKDRILFWITPVSVLLSFICFWIALSQVSLMAHAMAWWRGAGKVPT